VRFLAVGGFAFGVTYVVLAPEHKLVQQLLSHVENKTDVENYIAKVKATSEDDRTNDKNEKDIKSELRNYRVFNALNLYNVKNENFYNNIVGYAKKNNYSYLVVSKLDFLNNTEQFSKVRELTKDARLIAKFGNNESGYSLAKTEIGPTLKPLFSITEFGPEIEIYKLLLN
jgi:leucyl-tRNA synthetase